jgi:hypothetical protein
MKKQLINLLLSSLSFFPLQAQQVFTLNQDSFETKGQNLELRIDNHNDLANSKGYFRANLQNVDLYVDRYGLFNHKFGAEQKNIFFNSVRENTKIDTSTRTLNLDILFETRNYDFGLNFLAYAPWDLEIKGEQSVSNNTIDSKTIFIGPDTLGEKLNGTFDQTSNLFYVGNKYGYVKGISNQRKSNTIDQKFNGEIEIDKSDENDLKTIFSISPLPNINYTNSDKEHNSYLTTYTDPINLFAQFNNMDFSEFGFDKSGLEILKNNIMDGTLIISSGNYKDQNIKRYEYNIEDRMRVADRIENIHYSRNGRFLDDMFFNNGFEIIQPIRKDINSLRKKLFNKKPAKNDFLDNLYAYNSFSLELSKKESPTYVFSSNINFKNFNFYGNIDSKKNYEIGISFGKILAGLNNGKGYGGHIIHENQ